MAALPDITGDEPAGPNLEFDPAFAELERLAQGKPEQQYGSTIVPAEEPEWKEVVANAWALMERTYDLRIMAQLAVGRLQREGAVGYTETLGLVLQVLKDRWGPVHPQLDPEDDNDPTLRANALLTLAEPVRVMRCLRNLPLARSARVGAVSWRDISIAAGSVEVEDGTPKITDGMIAGAFRETDPAALDSLRQALIEAAAHSVAIPEVFNENAGYGTGPDFTDLTKLLRDMLHMLDTHAQALADSLEHEADTETNEEAGDDLDDTASASPRMTRSAPATTIATMGPPTNRADAMRLLDLVIAFYERYEPSSPLPLLIGRARRLADMGFLDILRDMAPDGIGQAELVAGRSSNE